MLTKAVDQFFGKILLLQTIYCLIFQKIIELVLQRVTANYNTCINGSVLVFGVGSPTRVTGNVVDPLKVYYSLLLSGCHIGINCIVK